MSSLGRAIERRDAFDYVMTFGQYKGRRLGEVPTDYLVWAVANLRGATAFVWQAKQELKRRSPPSEGVRAFYERSLDDLLLILASRPTDRVAGLLGAFSPREAFAKPI